MTARATICAKRYGMIDRARKLYALAGDRTEPEAETARAQARKLCEEHEITEAELAAVARPKGPTAVDWADFDAAFREVAEAGSYFERKHKRKAGR